MRKYFYELPLRSQQIKAITKDYIELTKRYSRYKMHRSKHINQSTRRLLNSSLGRLFLSFPYGEVYVQWYSWIQSQYSILEEDTLFNQKETSY